MNTTYKSTVSLREAIKNLEQEQLNQKLPFVIYNKPNESELIGLFQKDAELTLVNDFKEKGFVFAPFEGEEIVLIPEIWKNHRTCHLLQADIYCQNYSLAW